MRRLFIVSLLSLTGLLMAAPAPTMAAVGSAAHQTQTVAKHGHKKEAGKGNKKHSKAGKKAAGKKQHKHNRKHKHSK